MADGIPPSLAAVVREYVETVAAVKRHTGELADVRDAYRDHQVQLGAMNISLQAVRTEVLGRLDAMEIKVLERLDGIARQLGTNGSGGEHA